MPQLNKVQALIKHLTTGAGAIQLPSQVTKITLTYQFGSRVYGLRHFLKSTLPRIQYNNPKVQVDLDRSKEPTPPQLTVEFANATQKVVDVKGMHSDKIYQRFVDVTTNKPQTQESLVTSESPGRTVGDDWQGLTSGGIAKVFLPALDALDQKLQALVRRQVELHNRLVEASQHNGWGTQLETIPHAGVLEQVHEYTAKLDGLRKRMIALESKSGQLVRRTERMHGLQNQAKQARRQFMTQQSQLDQAIEAQRVSPIQATSPSEPRTSLSPVVEPSRSPKPATPAGTNDIGLGHASGDQPVVQGDNGDTMASRWPLSQTDTGTITESPTPSKAVSRTQVTRKKRQPRKVTID
ncbi:hypothetical protein IWQ62_001790 [Dispira parvispora]|uniref:Ribosomal protein/NADH dehydrogenase domain-containing protein n=1 Tax=Dispira parvispora TaxID=1520584 RepID=A0A9W8AX53_9FUNG|nr:hypothetical protein IWQ62_001790 [Dispira parvispora]